MVAIVTLKKVEYRKLDLTGEFPLVREYQQTPGKKEGTMIIDASGSKFNSELLARGVKTESIRIKLKPTQFTVDGTLETLLDEKESSSPANDPNIPLDGEYNGETERQAIKRIGTRFEVLDEVTTALADGFIRSAIVSGPPGVGKSFGIEKSLEVSTVMASLKQDGGDAYKFVRGSISPVGLYRELYKFSDKGKVIVFDDCDDVLLDPISLSLLKAALDSQKKRFISWNKENSALKNEGVPDRFEFKGSVIFITNMDFMGVRSKVLKPHLEAMMSRCHYLSLDIVTLRDKFLRIKGVVMNSDMLEDYDFDDKQVEEILSYMRDNIAKLNELSLRTVLKIADLIKLKQGGDWQRIANITLMKKASYV